MNSITTGNAPTSVVPKRVLSFLLVAMLVITAFAALFDDQGALLNSGGLLTLLWPTLMIAVASYWLRVFLAERIYFDTDIHAHSQLSGSGLYMAPVYFALG